MNLVRYPSLSSYATFANNPVWFSDPLGLDTLLPNPSGKNFYLPDAVSDIKYFTSETAKGGISGREYLVKSESVKSFSIKDKTFNARFDIESGNFIGYKTSEGELYNPYDYLPELVKDVVIRNRSMAGLISFSANLESSFIISANVSWAINILNTGDDISWFYTRSESRGWGLGVDWGLNITELNYVGPNPLNTVTINDVLGNFTYYQFNLLYGKGNYKSYDEKGNITWQDITTGIGFGFGGSWARGRTYKN